MEVLESSGVSDASVASCGDGSEQHSCCVEGSENLGEHILEDFDSYMEDINGRLTILRMVSDSVIKGMVTAFEQEAINEIAMKELEVAKLKETLLFYHVGADETELSSSPLKYRFYCSGSDPLVEHCTMRESLSNSIVEAKNQFKKLKTEIDNMRGCSSLTRMSSGSDLVGLVGIQRDNASERWVDVDEKLHSLQSSLDNVYRQAECTAYLSKVSFDEWQQEQVFQEEIKDMVISNCFRSLQEEFEERLWDLNAQLCGSESVKWLERTNEISNLRQDLNTIYKSLSMSESEQLTSHGSLNNFEEWNNSKKTDHFDRKVLSSHVSFSPLFSEENGKHESESIMLKNLEPLKIMSKDELLDHFKAEMTKMKRDHESEVQKMTDHYFSLKREYLKERECVPLKRGHSLPLKRDKDFDILRKKIPEVILKLDDILVENEKLPASNNLAKNIGSLKDRLHVLLAENRQLRDSLADKKKEVKRLSSQVSDASDKLLKHSVTEANLLKIISSLEGVIEDAHLKTSISDDVCKCVLEEGIGLIKYNCKESHVESAHNAKAGSRCEIQDSDIESVIMEGLLGIIYREAVKDVEVKVSKLYEEYIKENSCLQMKLLDKEQALTVEAEEKERVKQEVLLLKSEIGVKEKFTLEAAAELAKEKQQFELANQENNRLRDHRDQQESLISECNIELDTLKCELAEAVEQINLYKVETSKLNQKLETAMKEVMETNEQKRVLLAGTQDRQTTLSVIEVQEMEHRKQMESTILFVHGLAKTVAEFECRVAEDIKNKSSRVNTANSHIQKLRRTGLWYKQKLEKRCSDLRKAEAEVDLLGDEVDALLSLLEKIYIALDHYSPILQHYPGIIEILKLVRRELSGESTKLF